MDYIFIYKDNNLDENKLLNRCFDYLNIGSSNIKLNHDKYGKPYLNNSKYNISFSDCDEYVVLGLSKNQIGIDLEIVKQRNYKHIVKRYFSKESNLINNIDDFIKYWTKKEAISKLLGLGLRLDFNKFELDKYNIETLKILDNYYLSIVSFDDINYQIIYL